MKDFRRLAVVTVAEVQKTRFWKIGSKITVEGFYMTAESRE